MAAGLNHNNNTGLWADLERGANTWENVPSIVRHAFAALQAGYSALQTQNEALTAKVDKLSDALRAQHAEHRAEAEALHAQIIRLPAVETAIVDRIEAMQR
jgi:cell division protein FtsB